jgi:hypothetical protein
MDAVIEPLVSEPPVLFTSSIVEGAVMLVATVGHITYKWKPVKDTTATVAAFEDGRVRILFSHFETATEARVRQPSTNPQPD